MTATSAARNIHGGVYHPFGPRPRFADRSALLHWARDKRDEDAIANPSHSNLHVGIDIQPIIYVKPETEAYA